MGTKQAIRKRFTIAGQVQGVGFRPFVYRLAADEGLCGSVANDSGGVIIEAQGRAGALSRFLDRLQTELPPLAAVDSLETKVLPPIEPANGRFVISPSREGEMADAQVTVDSVICVDCLRELFDPSDRRYRYPFINCTNCGPRYSMVRKVPYDRPNTTMAGFTMCDDCRAEYEDPADRRYHAQPIACPVCGPRVWLADASGGELPSDDPVAEAARLLRDGKIVAIKGLGGFQLAVRADEEGAVRRLRRRKRRQAKPFALMAGDIETARRLIRLDEPSQRVLTGPRGPIILAERTPDANVAEAVAEGTDLLGVMLPTTPLHHLLFAHDLPPLVMTSGNMSEEPLVKDNDEAVERLGSIADVLLLHDRPIERRVDDSIVIGDGTGEVVPVRRARGYAPTPLRMTTRRRTDIPVRPPSPAILAVGAELKNTFCLYKDARALVSEHIGDLEDARTYRHFANTIAHLETLYAFTPEVIAADLHPTYLSTRYALRRSAGRLEGCLAAPLVRVQHHHAHVVSVMAEHDRVEPVIGIAADGTGYGDDGTVWGCEILKASPVGYDRLGHLQCFDLPGGDLAARETFRPALSLLLHTFGEAGESKARQLLEADSARIEATAEMLRSGVQCVACSSLGRLFDAVSALCRVASANHFEGEAPMALEAVARRDVDEAFPFDLLEGECFEIDVRPMIAKIVEDLAKGTPVADISACFHNAVADFLLAAALRAREITGIDTVALSGGCFINRKMTSRLVVRLKAAGLEVLTHRRFPCNDACISLGQATVAAFTKG